jgi:hypothetical protein
VLPANTLVRWVNENAFVLEVQTRPYPTFGRPVHPGDGPHRLRPGTYPHALRIPPYGGHPALRSAASGGFRSVLAVSSFRLRARLDVSIPSTFSGQRGYEPRFLDMAPHLSTRGTLTLMNNALLSAHFRVADHPTRRSTSGQLAKGGLRIRKKPCQYTNRVAGWTECKGHPSQSPAFPWSTALGPCCFRLRAEPPSFSLLRV